MVPTTLRVAVLAPTRRPRVMAPGWAALGCHTIWYFDPAGTLSLWAGLVIALKPGVTSARAVAAKARTAAKEKRIICCFAPLPHWILTARCVICDGPADRRKRGERVGVL